jgi:hypothetical protein
MKNKIKIWAMIAFAMIGLGFYGVHEYFRPNKDISELKETARVSGIGLIHEFETSDTITSRKYIGKIIIVQGKLKTIEKDEKGYCTLVLGDDGAMMSSVRCDIDTLHNKEVSLLKEGNPINIKGIVTGYYADATGLLGSDVQLSRCMVLNEK